MMSKNAREQEKRLARAILIWAVCSIRPLKVAELEYALTQDSGTKVLCLEKLIETLCGQLLYIDKSNIVQMVHSTARDFLIDPSLSSEFAVRRETGHERLAMTCLEYLSSDDMRPPCNPKLATKIRRTGSHESRDYACTAFSEHLAGSPSDVDNIMLTLDRFLKTNALTWIEHIARKKNLYHLTCTAKNFRTYLERRAKHVSPLESKLRTIDSWATELVRLAAKFGTFLLTYPPSIYFLIPPFCPSESNIHKQYARSGGLTAAGLSNDEWEDCIAYIAYRNSPATALACGENLFALGHKSGHILLYHQSTCH